MPAPPGSFHPATVLSADPAAAEVPAPAVSAPCGPACGPGESVGAGEVGPGWGRGRARHGEEGTAAAAGRAAHAGVPLPVLRLPRRRARDPLLPVPELRVLRGPALPRV